MMFKFGENWASFSRQLDEDCINTARQSLISLFGENELKGKSFLDIGCGSGLFSIAAAQLGAVVTGIDIDPVSVQTSQENSKKWLPDLLPENFQIGSVLDDEKIKTLGRFDIVYSWGVLHHTNSMTCALQNAAHCVKSGGLLMVARSIIDIGLHLYGSRSSGYIIIWEVGNKKFSFGYLYLLFSWRSGW